MRNGLADYLRNFEHRGGFVISPRDKWIWMKPAKTAGSSIARKLIEPYTPNLQWKKQRRQYVDWLENITDVELEDYFIWATIRNPWARLISALFYFHIRPEDFFREPGLRDEVPGLHAHTIPQVDYIYVDGRPQTFLDDLVCVETIQHDWNRVARKLGLEPRRVPHMNRTTHDPYQAYYDKRGREAIKELWPDDLLILGYQF